MNGKARVKLAATCALLLVLAPRVSSAQNEPRVETGFLDRTIQIGTQAIRYQVYVPAEYTPARTWPVLVHLHGGGPQGTDGLSHTLRISEQILINRSRFPFLVINPQAQPRRRWLDPDMQEMVIAQIDKTMAEFAVDPDRVYLTGFSMGAAGVYGMAYRWPERFAAVAAIAGRVEAASGTDQAARRANGFLAASDPFAALAERIKGIPIWIIHGTADEGMSIGQSRRLVPALKAAKAAGAAGAAGADVRYTEYRGTNHDDTGYRAFAEPDLLRWLLEQRRRPPAP